jgi:hypothetical protein
MQQETRRKLPANGDDSRHIVCHTFGMSETMPTDQVTLRTEWKAATADDASPVNQVLIQQGFPIGQGGVPDGVYLTFGHVSPPLINPQATPEEVVQFAKDNVLQVRTIAQLYMSIDRLKELEGILADFIGKVAP